MNGKRREWVVGGLIGVLLTTLVGIGLIGEVSFDQARVAAFGIDEVLQLVLVADAQHGPVLAIGALPGSND